MTAAFFYKEKKFFNIYSAIINEVKKKFKFKFLFQEDPFLRFNFPSNSVIDTFLPHVDLCLGHPPGEINFWVPVTDVAYNNSLLISNFDDSIIFFEKFAFNFMEYEKAYRKKFGIKSTLIKLNKIHCSPREQEWLEEFQEIVTETATMSKDDWVKRNTFSVILMLMHSFKLGFYFINYFMNELKIPAKDFLGGHREVCKLKNYAIYL